MSSFFGSSDFYSNLITTRQAKGAVVDDDNDDTASELEILIHAYLRDVHYSTRRKTIFNVIYANLNAAFVALPLAAEFAGIPLFTFAVLFFSICSGYTSCIVVNMFTENGVRTLEDLCTKGYGRAGFIIVCVFELLLSVSLMCITLDVWADISSYVFGTFNHIPDKLTHRSFGLMIGALLILPLCLVGRSMSKLGWSSIFSVISIIAAVCCLATAMACDLDGGHDGVRQRTKFFALCSGSHLWWLLPLIATFCFANNQKSFAAYSSLRRRSAHRWKYVIRRSHGILALMYISFGVLGYLSDVKTNRALDNIDYFLEFEGTGKNRVYFDVLSGIVALSLLLTVPVDCLVATTTCKRLYIKLFRRRRPTCCNRLMGSIARCCCGWIGHFDSNGSGTGTGYSKVRASDLVDYDNIYAEEEEGGRYDQEALGRNRIPKQRGGSSSINHSPNIKSDAQRQDSSGGSSTNEASSYDNKYRGDTWCSDELLSPYAVAVADEAERNGVVLSDDMTPEKTSSTDKRGWRSLLDNNNKQQRQNSTNNDNSTASSNVTVIRNILHTKTASHSNDITPPRKIPGADSNISSITDISTATDDVMVHGSKPFPSIFPSSTTASSTAAVGSSGNLNNDIQTTKAKSNPQLKQKRFEALRVTTSEIMSVGSFDSRTNSVDISIASDHSGFGTSTGASAASSGKGRSNPVRVESTILETASEGAVSASAATNERQNSGDGSYQGSPGGWLGEDCDVAAVGADDQGNNSNITVTGANESTVHNTKVNSVSVNSPHRNLTKDSSSNGNSNNNNNTPSSKGLNAQYVAVKKANSTSAIITSNTSNAGLGNTNSNSSANSETNNTTAVRKTVSSSAVLTIDQINNNNINNISNNRQKRRVSHETTSQMSASETSFKSDTPHLDALMAAMTLEKRVLQQHRHSGTSKSSFSNYSNHGGNRRDRSMDSGSRHSRQGANAEDDIYYEPRSSYDNEEEDDDEFNPEVVSEEEDEESDDEDIEFTFDSQRINLYPGRSRYGQHRHREHDKPSASAAANRDDDDDGEEDDQVGPIDATDIEEQYRIIQQRREASANDICNIAEVGPVFLVWAFTLLLCASYEKLGLIGIVMGPLSTAVLVYIIPSALYFRLGLATDYQASPICGVIPNKFFMQCIQLFGIILFFANFVIVMYALVKWEALISL